MTEQEQKYCEGLGWKTQHRARVVEQTELDIPVDLIVVDKLSRVVTSKCVWQDIRDIGRLKRLQAREQASYGAECEVVAVEARTTSLGQVLQDNQVIKL